jgi:hypothetical protein
VTHACSSASTVIASLKSILSRNGLFIESTVYIKYRSKQEAGEKYAAIAVIYVAHLS